MSDARPGSEALDGLQAGGRDDCEREHGEAHASQKRMIGLHGSFSRQDFTGGLCRAPETSADARSLACRGCPGVVCGKGGADGRFLRSRTRRGVFAGECLLQAVQLIHRHFPFARAGAFSRHACATTPCFRRSRGFLPPRHAKVPPPRRAGPSRAARARAPATPRAATPLRCSRVGVVGVLGFPQHAIFLHQRLRRPPPPQEIAAPIDHDADEPGGETAAIVEMPDPGRQRHADVLRDVFRIHGRADIAPGDPVDQAVMDLQQAPESLPVARGRRLRKLAIVGRLQHLSLRRSAARKSLAARTDIFLAAAPKLAGAKGFLRSMAEEVTFCSA